MRYALFWGITRRMLAVLNDVPVQLTGLILEDGTDRLFRNVVKELPPYNPSCTRRAQIPAAQMLAADPNRDY